MMDNQQDSHDAWRWIDGVSGCGNMADAEGLETARKFARVFSHHDSRHVLDHLRKSTRDRVFGPDVSEATLRYVEGQRALVAYMETMIERGRGSVLKTGKSI